MKYDIVFKPRAFKDLKNITPIDGQTILKDIEAMQHDLAGNVKKLTNHTQEYRLRVGNYRVLFDISDSNITIYRILHRKDAYR